MVLFNTTGEVARNQSDAIVISSFNNFKHAIATKVDATPQNAASFVFGLQSYITEVQSGFNISFGLSGSEHGINAAVESWGEKLRARYGTTRISPEFDPTNTKLGYWTGNCLMSCCFYVCCLFFCLPAWSVFVCGHSSFCLSIRLSVCLSVHLSICLCSLFTYRYTSAQPVCLPPACIVSLSFLISYIGSITDNGAYYDGSYWQQNPTAVAQDVLVDVKMLLDTMGVPISYIQLDPWWYPNGNGCIEWIPKENLFPKGLSWLR